MVKTKTMTRRNFLRNGVLVPIVSAALGSRAFSPGSLLAASTQAPAAPTNLRIGSGSTSKTLLTQADITYVGAFNMPANLPNVGDPTFGTALACRYVNGSLRMFSSAWGAPSGIYEIVVPSLSKASPFPTATLLNNWGTTWINNTQTGSGNPVRLWGLYWDAADKRLYVSHGADYNSAAPNDPSLLYLTLNDTAGTCTATGPWGFSGRIVEQTMGGILPIPQWYAAAYTNGQRLGGDSVAHFPVR